MTQQQTPSREQWLAVAMASESQEPHEWPLIGWAIRNRSTSGRYPREIRDVILQPSQFSYFNDLKGEPEEVYHAALQGYAGAKAGEALACAVAVLSAPLWAAPFAPSVCHYYSPVSMKPKGSAPAWEKAASFLFTPAGVDPQRFVFAAGVK